MLTIIICTLTGLCLGVALEKHLAERRERSIKLPMATRIPNFARKQAY